MATAELETTGVAGGVLASWVLIPAIKLFGDGLTTPLHPADKLISEMGADDSAPRRS